MVDSNILLKIARLEELNKVMRDEIDDIKSSKKEMEYMLLTCNIINSYIELEDKEKELIMRDDGNIEYELYEINQKKNNIIDDYMRIVDPNYTSFRQSECERKDIFCEICNTYLIVSSGFAVCYDCGLSVRVIQESNELSYKELQEMDYRPQFTYQKSTHLADWLRRFQAKEHKQIPQEILDKVILEAHKQRVKDLSTLSELQVKKFLKKLNLNDYYDNVISIINRINKGICFIFLNFIFIEINYINLI